MEQGVNTVVWFNINLKKDDRGKPVIESCTDMACVSEVTLIIAYTQS